MKFGDAIEALKDGGCVARSGWNGKGMYIYLATFDGFEPVFVMFTASKQFQPGWLASQADMLAEDWVAVEP
jgi:hypothetical protein